MTSTRFHTHVKFARYKLPGLAGVTLWRLVVQTRAGDRITRVDYLALEEIIQAFSS